MTGLPAVVDVGDVERVGEDGVAPGEGAVVEERQPGDVDAHRDGVPVGAGGLDDDDGAGLRLVLEGVGQRAGEPAGGAGVGERAAGRQGGRGARQVGPDVQVGVAVGAEHLELQGVAERPGSDPGVVVPVAGEQVSADGHQPVAGVGAQDAQSAHGPSARGGEAREDAVTGEDEVAAEAGGQGGRAQRAGVDDGGGDEAVFGTGGVGVGVEGEAGRHEGSEEVRWEGVGEDEGVREAGAHRDGMALQQVSHGRLRR